ncbi:MAG TPA: UDP-N-acetylmuramoyl-tripeptide--D-alanyl-D-alanine ligase [Candidatus Binatia bacterium]|nr:UDP-N-acetylmuramoyl-tripeptide--D-alanyl-D-alanine ligase [Candidatus Binatia bacterium]
MDAPAEGAIAHALRLSAGEIAEAAGARLVSGDPSARFAGVAIDSRQVEPGTLFVALPGAKVDGHDFVPQALARGATGILTSRGDAVAGAAVTIAADDTLAALQAAAREWRSRLRATVVGIAGSNGKTTTKEVVASVLGVRGRTFATPGNENSQVGAPMAILAAPLDTQFLVLELGTSAPGELGRLASFARPHVAIVTAAFAEHLEFLGSIAGVIEAETEILGHLPAGALALVGSAEPGLVAAARRRQGIRVETVGTRAEDDVRLERFRLTRAGTELVVSGATWRVPLLGEPGAWAAAFAIAVARELGLSDDEIRRGLERARPAAHRMRAVADPARALFAIDDCYNSNPASAIAAIDAASALRAPGDRLVLVLGDMLELGATSVDAHRDVGREAARRASDARVVAVGAEAGVLAEAARAHGAVAEHVSDAERAGERVRELLSDGIPTTLLVKGSRGVGLERVLAALALDPESGASR